MSDTTEHASARKRLAFRLTAKDVIVVLLGFVAAYLLADIAADKLDPFLAALDSRYLAVWFALILLLGVVVSRSGKRLIARYRNNNQLRSRRRLELVEKVFLGLAVATVAIVLTALDADSREFAFICLGSLAALLVPSLALSRRSASEGLASPKSSDEDRPSDPLVDEAIRYREQDLLGADQFAKDLLRQIENLPSERQFVLGLVGPQGDGKTSILNLLQLAFAERVPHKFIVVPFDPWYFASAAAIVENFYRVVDEAVNKRFLLPDLSALLRRYRSLLLSGVGALLGSRIETDHTDDVLAVKLEIERLLESVGFRIILLIDDLDRLERDELKAVLKLVRLTADFPRLFVVLSYDPARWALKDEDSLPEKVVQMAITTPRISSDFLGQFVYWSSPAGAPTTRLSAIDRLFEELGVPPKAKAAFESQMTQLYLTDFKWAFWNLREAKRFLMALRSSLRPIWREINLFDFVLMEYLKVFAYEVWNDIARHPDVYVQGHAGPAGILADFLDDTDTSRKLVRDHVEAAVGRSRSERQSLVRILVQKLFPKVRAAFTHSTAPESSLAERRVQTAECFERYFTLSLGEGEVADSDIEGILGQAEVLEGDAAVAFWSEQLSKYQRRKTLPRALAKLEVYGRLDAGSAEPLIRALMRSPHTKESTGLMDFEGPLARSRHLVMTMLERLDAESARRLLSIAVHESPTSLLGMRLARYSQPQYGGGGIPAVRSQELSAELGELIGRSLAVEFLAAKRDVFKTFGLWAVQVLADWASFTGGWSGVEAYVTWLLGQHPMYWQTIVGAFRTVSGGLNLQDFRSFLDPEWFARFGESHPEVLDDEIWKKSLAALRANPA